MGDARTTGARAPSPADLEQPLKTIRVRCFTLFTTSMEPDYAREARATLGRTYQVPGYEEAARRYAADAASVLGVSCELDLGVQEIHPDGSPDQEVIYRRVKAVRTFLVTLPHPQLPGEPAEPATAQQPALPSRTGGAA